MLMMDPPPAAHHFGDGVLAGQHLAAQVHRHRRLPDVDLQLGHGGIAARGSPNRSRRRCCAGRRAGRTARRPRPRAPATWLSAARSTDEGRRLRARRPDVRGHRLGGLLVDVGDQDGRSGPGQGPGRRSADAASAAGDDGNLAAQTLHELLHPGTGLPAGAPGRADVQAPQLTVPTLWPDRVLRRNSRRLSPGASRARMPKQDHSAFEQPRRCSRVSWHRARSAHPNRSSREAAVDTVRSCARGGEERDPHASVELSRRTEVAGSSRRRRCARRDLRGNHQRTGLHVALAVARAGREDARPGSLPVTRGRSRRRVPRGSGVPRPVLGL